jgi:hypothetical protein
MMHIGSDNLVELQQRPMANRSAVLLCTSGPVLRLLFPWQLQQLQTLQ